MCRFLAQNHELLRAIAATINDVDAPPQAQGYAASALRNLATDLWVGISFSTCPACQPKSASLHFSLSLTPIQCEEQGDERGGVAEEERAREGYQSA